MYRKCFFIILLTQFIVTACLSQNILLNIITPNSGIVKVNDSTYVELTINNTDPAVHTGVYKIKVQLSIPGAIATIPEAGHLLPDNWTILNNTGSVITLSNGKNMIAAGDARTIRIKLIGIKQGGPSTIAGQVSFSDGNAPGTAPGLLPGDNPADNASTTTIKVIR